MTIVDSRFHVTLSRPSLVSLRLSNDKPSAIFKLKSGPSGSNPAVSGSSVINIGISCEPVASVQAQIASLHTRSSSASSTALVPSAGGAASATTVGKTEVLAIAMKCAKNFLNYLSSFAQSAPAGSSLQAISQDPSAQSAIIGICERWYKNIETKTKNNVDWLNRDD